jgi:hypothetical protein
MFKGLGRWESKNNLNLAIIADASAEVLLTSKVEFKN